MLKTSKATQPKSITTSRTKVKVITTSSTRKSRSETTSITNKKLFKLSTTTPFTSLRTPTSSSPSSLPTATSSTLSSSFSPTTTSPTTTTSKSLLYPTLSLPHSSLPTSTSSSSLSSLSSLPFTTIFNLQSQQQQPQQESQLESFIITPHLHQQFKNQFYSLTRSFQHKLLSQSNIFHSTKVQFKDESKPDYSNLDFEPLSEESGSFLTPYVITFKYLNSNEFKATMEEFESECLGLDLDIPLRTFIAAVEEHYPSKPLASVANFISVNRTIFKRLFQHQIVKAIPSLDKNTTGQNEIVQIIFDEYHDLTTLILKLRGKGYTDEEIGSLLRKIYPKHYHKEIDHTLSSKDSTQTQVVKYSEPKTIQVNGRAVAIHYQTGMFKAPQHISQLLESTLQHHQQLLTAIEVSCDKFVESFRHPAIQKIIGDNKDWYSNSIHSQQIHRILQRNFSPSFHPLDSSVILSARHAIPDPRSTFPLVNAINDAINTLMNAIGDFKNKCKFKLNQMILPLLNNHLVLSYQQVLIIIAVGCLFKATKDQKPTRDEELIFQFLTGLTLAEYKQLHITLNVWSLILHGSHGIGKSLLLFLLFILSVFNVDWSPKVATQSQVNVEQSKLTHVDAEQSEIIINSARKTKIDVLTCHRTDNTMFQIEARKDDDGYLSELYVRATVLPFTSNTDLVFHAYDEAESPLSRHPEENKELQSTQSSPQTPRLPSDSPTISNGLEVRFLSAQEHVIVSDNPQPKAQAAFLPPVSYPSINPQVSKQIYLCTTASYIQTMLSLIKSSLYRHYLEHNPTATLHQQQLFLIELNKLTIDDLYDINLFNEWDAGQSLQIVQNVNSIDVSNEPVRAKKPLKSITLATEYTQSIMYPEYVSDPTPTQLETELLIEEELKLQEVKIEVLKIEQEFKSKQGLQVEVLNGHEEQTKMEQLMVSKNNRIEKLIQIAFQLTNIDDDQNNIIIQSYLSQFLYELRLLPYVSPSMRSASNFYSTLLQSTTHQPITSSIQQEQINKSTDHYQPITPSVIEAEEKQVSRLNRFDLFSRFFPIPFHNLNLLQLSEQKHPPTLLKFDSLVHFSQLPRFIQQSKPYLFDQCVTLTTNMPIVQKSGIRLQQQVDQLLHYSSSTTIQQYFSQDPKTYFSKKYASNCLHHYYIDTTNYKSILSTQPPTEQSPTEPFTPSTPPINNFSHLDPHNEDHRRKFQYPYTPTRQRDVYWPLQLSQSTDDTQRQTINTLIRDAVEHVHKIYSMRNVPISIFLGTGGAVTYPAFDHALIYYHPDSTPQKVQIGIHFVQTTTDSSRNQPHVTPTSIDLYDKVVAIESKLGIIIRMDDWSYLSQNPVRFFPSPELTLNEQEKEKITHDAAKVLKVDSHPEKAAELVSLIELKEKELLTKKHKVKNKLSFLNKNPVNVISNTIQWPEIFNPFGNDLFKH